MTKQGFHLEECRTGYDFENWVAGLLTSCGFDTKRTKNDDNGVDIIASKNVKDTEYTFYIQCKFYNRTLGKAPIQEVYTGHQYFGGNGYPVVITNNRMTAEAKGYANKLGVEVISEIDINTLKLSFKQQKPLCTTYKGLMGLLMSTVCRSESYFKSVLSDLDSKPQKECLTDKEQLKLELINNFEQVDILIQESSELQQRAIELQRQANNLQKIALLKNLDYG